MKMIMTTDLLECPKCQSAILPGADYCQNCKYDLAIARRRIERANRVPKYSSIELKAIALAYFMGGVPLIIAGFILTNISIIAGGFGAVGAMIYGIIAAYWLQSKRANRKPAYFIIPLAILVYAIGALATFTGPR